MPQNRCLAVLFLWLGCLLTVARAGPLALYWEVGGKSLPVAGVEHNRIYCLVDGKEVTIPREAKWRLEGDLRENARFVDWSPAYNAWYRDMPDWEAEKTIEPFQVTVSMIHRSESRGKPVNSPFLKNWPEGLPTAGLGVFAWVQDGKAVKVETDSMPSTVLAKFFSADAKFTLTRAETAGQPVTLVWREGGFAAVAPRFAETAAQAAFLAVEANDVAALKAALAAGLKPAVLDRGGYSLLHYAAEAGHLEAANLLLAAGTPPDINQEKVETPLQWAVKSGRLETARRLVAAGADKDIHRKMAAPLRLAINARFSDIAIMLIEAKADLKEVDDAGRTPMLVAFDAGLADVVRAIRAQKYRGDYNEDQATRVLITQASLGHTALVELMLEDNVMPQAELRDFTPLIAGAIPGDPAIAKALLRAGAKVGQATDSGNTPLLAAAANGRAEYAAVLLKAGADPNGRLPDGTTALHLAATARAGEVATLLLAYGANPNAVNHLGTTPLQMALMTRTRDAANALAAKGAKLELKAAGAADLLEIAVAIDAETVVQNALADGWSPQTEFRGAWPALMVAEQCGAKGCAALLRAAGAKESEPDKAPLMAKSRELDEPLRLVAAVQPKDPRDLFEGFPAAVVQLDAVVDRNGEVRFPRVVGSPKSILAVAVLEAVSAWKFTLPAHNKESVATKVRIPVAFASSRDLASELSELDVRPVPIKRVAPSYPPDLASSGDYGDVRLRFMVNADGHVEHIRVVSSQHPALDASAVKAVAQWIFKPGELAGKPKAAWVELPVSFRLQ